MEIDGYSENVAGWVRSRDDALILIYELPKIQAESSDNRAIENKALHNGRDLWTISRRVLWRGGDSRRMESDGCEARVNHRFGGQTLRPEKPSCVAAFAFIVCAGVSA